MASGEKTPPEIIGQIQALTRRGVGGRQIARELGMPHTTVHSIIRNVLLVIPPKRQPKANSKNQSLNTGASVDYGKAKVTTVALPSDYGRVCNAAVRETYVPTELKYRGRA